jgi:hypothetical protein
MRVRSALCVSVACGAAVLALSGTFVLHAFAQSESATRDPGIYIAASAQTPPRYEVVHAHGASGSHQSGTGKSVLTMGLTGIDVTLDINGSAAALRAPSGDVVFPFQLNKPPAKPSKGSSQQPQDISAIMAQAARDQEMPLGLKSPDSFSLIRATIDGNTRRLDLGSQGGSKILGGHHAKDAVAFSVEKLGSDVFRVRPKSPLSPGEYAFSITQGSSQVWDFGVDGK